MNVQVQSPPGSSDAAARPRYLGEVVKSISGESTDWHNHDFGQLVSSISGSLYLGTAKQVLLLSPAMALWIPPDAEHWNRTSSNNEMLFVDLNRDEAKHVGTHCRVMAMTPLLRALMEATLPDRATNRNFEHTSKLHDLLRQELIAAKDVPLSIVMPQDKRIHDLAEAAFANPTIVGSVDSWLKDAAASRRTIERLFILETGMPPSRWLRHVRVLHAVSQLAAGEKISSVALDMGYESPSAFSYMFRQTLGVSPSTFALKTSFAAS